MKMAEAIKNIKLSKIKNINTNTARKVSKYGDSSGSYFPVFRLNTERYSVSLRIQSEYRKIRTGQEITRYLDTFHTVAGHSKIYEWEIYSIRIIKLAHWIWLKSRMSKLSQESGDEDANAKGASI